MALLTETFGLFVNDTLTNSFSGEYTLIHNTDESDNPNDRLLYLGSLGSGGADTEDRKIQALSDPGVDDIQCSIVYILPEWEATTSYSVGDCVEPVTPDGFRYRCTTAGTSDTTEPVWSGMGGIGSTIVDGTVVWTKVSAIHPTSEIILALSQGDLDTNTPGVPLVLNNTIISGTANAIPIYIRINNSVNTVSDNSATPELALSLSSMIELENL